MARRTRTRRQARNGTNGRNGRSNGSGAYRLFDDVLALTSTLVDNRKQFGADRLMTLAASTRDFAAALPDMPNLRSTASTAAESLEDFADYVLHTEIEDMVGDANVFARRHPIMTLALSVGAGLAASGYLRTRSEAPSRSGRKAGTRSSARRTNRQKPQRKTADDRPGADA